MRAFCDLSTTRSYGMGVGPIPWNRIMEFAAWKGLGYSNTDILVEVIRAMDTVYIEWVNSSSDHG